MFTTPVPVADCCRQAARSKLGLRRINHKALVTKKPDNVIRANSDNVDTGAGMAIVG
jgi:hypothetical protein